MEATSDSVADSTRLKEAPIAEDQMYPREGGMTFPSHMQDDPNSPLEKFGMVVSILRQKKGLKIKDLAQASGIDLLTLIDIESGKAALDQVVINLPKLASATGADPQVLSRVLLHLGRASEFNPNSAPTIS